MASILSDGGAPTALTLAKTLVLMVPAGLLAGAYGSQYIGGLAPCEMCYWQRWAHFAGLAFALLAFAPGGRLPDRGRSLVWLGALCIAASGAIGFYHAGVELRWFEGFTQCTTQVAGGSTDELLRRILEAPVVRCDEVQWSWLGLSMAAWNAIISLGAALAIAWLSLKRPTAAG